MAWRFGAAQCCALLTSWQGVAERSAALQGLKNMR